MTYFRSIALAVAISGVSLLTACTNAPAKPISSAPASNMVTPERMAAMDVQMKIMRAMHTKMMNAKTPEERQALMGEHMKAMQGGMDMMKDMSGMGDSKGMQADMAQHHTMMTQHMAMMQMMMDMMSQRMPPASGKQ